MCHDTLSKATFPSDAGNDYLSEGSSVNFENINFYGKMTSADNNCSLVTKFAHGGINKATNLNLKDCTSYVDIICTSQTYSGIFVGRTCRVNNTKININFDNCVNKGTLICANSSAGMLISNSTQLINCSLTLNVNNCKNEGMIAAKKNAELVCGGILSLTSDSNIKCENNKYNYESSQLGNVDGFVISNSSNVGSLNDKTEYPNISLATSYKVMFTTNMKKDNNSGNVAETLTFNANQLSDFNTKFPLSTEFGKITQNKGEAVTWINLDGTTVTFYKDNDKLYFYDTAFAKGSGYSVSTVSITLIGYNNEGSVVGIYVK